MDTLDSMSDKRKSYPVPTDKILEDNWHYEKPVTKEFSTVETPTKKKGVKVRQQTRKWAPIQHNSQIWEQACGRHCKYEVGSVSMDHKQICRLQVSDIFEQGGRARLKNAKRETRKFNCMLYNATEKSKSKDMHWTFVFVFKTCCFSVHVKWICEEFACREPNLNEKLVIAASAVSYVRLCGKLLHYECWLGGHRTVGS